jgi:Protein of unknown function (DUF2802)
MMIDTYFLSTYVLPLASLLLVGAAALALVRVHLAIGSDAIDSTLAAGREICKEIETLRALCEDTLSRQADIAGRIAVLEDKIDATGRVERLVVESAPRSASMEHAARMARGGASIDELTRSCGLNLGEASLMRRLHGHGESSRPS